MLPSIFKISKIVSVAFFMVTLISFTTNSSKSLSLEKIYTQTDRPFYFPEETIWFKSYIVDAEHKVSSLSDVMIAELISPKGSIIKKVRISINQGYAYGHFDIKKDWVGGIYTLKMYTHWMKNYGDESFFTKKINIQKVVQPNLLLNLKFEKEGYGKASEVTANFKAKDLKNKPLSNTKITFNVSVKGKKMLSQKNVTDNEGKAKLSFRLPPDLSTTDVILNILIPYQGTTESISRSVPVLLDTVDLQFFPESGNLITGTKNVIAFKAINEFGKPADISGIISDSNGNQITDFSSYHDGMGSFILNPKSNESYYAKITKPFISEKVIALPKAIKNGVRFSVKTDSEKTTLDIFSRSVQTLRLEVSNPSKTLIQQAIDPKQEIVVLDTKNFPIGITKFTLLDKNNTPLAERLVFLNPNKKLNIDICLNKEVYETREKVKVTVKTTDDKGLPIPSNISLAVADNKLLSFADDKQDHIESYLLMSSELKGKIHKPIFYFDPEEQKSQQALDYVMLTHGWRNYIIKNDVTLENATFQPELKSIQSGSVVDLKGRPVKAHILLFDQYGNKALAFDTDNNGNFSFKVGKVSSYTMIAYSDDKRPLKIRKDKRNYKNSSTTRQKGNEIHDSSKKNPFYGVKKPLQKPIKQKARASVALNEDSASLDEVVVTGLGYANKRKMVYSVTVINEEDITSNNIAQLLQGSVSGVQVINADGIYGNASKISIRGATSISGNNQPLIVIDGVPLSNNSIDTIDSDQVQSVTVLKSAIATSLYGYQAGNGVIVITTKNRNYINNTRKKKLNNAKYNNYAFENFYNNRSITNYITKRFYVPVYDGKIEPEKRTDFRQTIYWNPIVQTDEKGEARLEFHNSDAITSFKVTAEGVGYNGLIGQKQKEYSTKKILSLDFKVPNYLAVNDTVVLPIIIKNEASQTIRGVIDLNLPKSIQIIDTLDKEVEISANSSIIKNVRVVPIQKQHKTLINVSVISSGTKDIVSKEVTILSPYFPNELSISGLNNQSFEFDINHVVKNSISAEFTIYTDIVGDVMNGVESMIQKPYGCFEQTSSSTYPNILILKYLKETGKSNIAIEKKAMNFIKEGYKRLIGFETKEGGFEWFGKTPPHETLTAYGILEFTEMKEIYPKVNQKMIQRTVDWLMSRRNGKGGFKKSNQGYDSFASSPTDVANAYIVYALSEAQIPVDIQKEYNFSYQDALQSMDTYKMALLALTSYNLNQPEKASTLITKIKENIDRHSFKELPVSNTITRSYGDSKNIETTAFTLLALMREKELNDTLISQGIEHLVNQRKGGRFGSTQSTCMALKTLIEYTKYNKKKIINSGDTIELTINGKKLSTKLAINKNGKITIDGITDFIIEGTQKVDVNFTNPEVTFPYALNITWDSSLPDSSPMGRVDLKTSITNKNYTVGDNIRMQVNAINTTEKRLPMVTTIIGIPSGASVQPWQLKEILEKQKVAFYEIFDNYLVLYWREFAPSETKTINLDLKADIAGKYQAPASTIYEYYADEYKKWISGNTLEIMK
ncbi:TonB-dependent receptor plug domain-containing protein [Aquimarina sp. 2201CG5-10]|uniref:TonB-dependent receptor plug domain-containing protein n=1 Tax=Aquimarina callyspongiae TaxID=3098150 RepID=UPI002AB3A2C1|nr:TonB-dependent receptor plug domain-containing protein [Aquimarina sp. 2201CG5-10]MDY8135256.1 TonB-dependent receptor plug domain-containing protein [Aquimarina sp. 2201CG5-10]